MRVKPDSVPAMTSEGNVSIELRKIPGPEERGLSALLRRRITVVRFLTVTSGVARDPIVLLTLLASVSRSGMIFAINETAQNYDQGFGWSVWLLIIAALTMLTASYFQRLRAFGIITRIMARLRMRMARQLLRANVDFLSSSPRGEVYSAATREVGELSGAVINVIEAIEAVVVLVIAVPYLFYVSWAAGLAAVFAVVIGVAGYLMLDLPARRHNSSASQTFANYCDRIGDMLSGWRELRQRQTRREAIEGVTMQAISDNVESHLQSEKLYSASTLVGQSAIVLLLCFVVIAIPLLQGGDTTTMFQVLTIVFLTNGPIEQMFNMMPRLSRAENAYYKIQKIEERLSAAQSNVLFGGGEVPDRFERIELRDVQATIREPGKPDAEPFHLGPINLAFEPGETVFICGGNGSGKTTLLSLITGLRHPDKGEILLDGHVLDDDTTSGYRELFCGVFSGFHLFDRAYGMDDGELAELDRRIKQLGLSERVTLHEDQFSSTSLSAGQSRRLALAVALAEQRPIIVLDEFAADQDPANRAFFYDVLVPELAATGQLVLAITHDDHQFGKCDRLIKMEGGRVVSDERQIRKAAS